MKRANLFVDDEAIAKALQEYLRLLVALAHDPDRDKNSVPPSRDAFVVMEQLRGGVAQAALAQAGARIAAGEPAERRRELGAEINRLWKQGIEQFVKEHNAPGRTESDDLLFERNLSDLHNKTAPVEQKMAVTTARLYQQFPAYAELAVPEPVNITELQALLRSDEALISFFTIDDRLLIWLVRHGKKSFYKDIQIKKSDLTKLVARLRASLDQSANPDLSSGQLLPFDVGGAHELFKLLIAPLREHLAGIKHLIIVPDEVLLSLPFGALLKQAEGKTYQKLTNLYRQKLSPSPAELAGYSKLSWLAKEYAITVLPSATSLRALRQISRQKGKEVEPLIAFGDPVLLGRGVQRGGIMLASRGGTVSVHEIRKLNRLPGTRDELLAMAKALGADPNKALFLSRRATKPNVMGLNKAGRLSKAQVISFATHGLIGGEVKGLKEPALVLTPPPQPSEQDDGLLGLEDILSLKLNNADWVILSACNTAAPGGSGEGLSGLVRAFFFAGAPSLLVSHWSVDDRATQALMTEVFSRYAKDKTMPRSEALRQGMLALMENAKGATAYFAHPYAWAPFFLVGEGSGETK